MVAREISLIRIIYDDEIKISDAKKPPPGLIMADLHR